MESSAESVRVLLDRSSDRSYDVVFTDLAELPRLMDACDLSSDACLIVTDANVAHLHGRRLAEILSGAGKYFREIVVEAGEPSKSLAAYGRTIDEALVSPIDRHTPVLAFGGGVVGDLAGFLAATLLRGLPLVQIPTSLVAQVDSAIGGKTGVNHTTGKNLIGAFYQPRLVLADTNVLQTLPDAEWLDGLSEIVKYGLIADAAFARRLADDWDQILAREPDVVRSVVRRCVEIKADVVSRDETEQGVRAVLNFGHTFGHALERVAGYHGLTHGQAVAIGMRAAVHLSAARHPEASLNEAAALVGRLPIVDVSADVEDLMGAMSSDKKKSGTRLRFILLEEFGRAVVDGGVTDVEIRDAWRHALQHGADYDSSSVS